MGFLESKSSNMCALRSGLRWKSLQRSPRVPSRTKGIYERRGSLEEQERNKGKRGRGRGERREEERHRGGNALPASAPRSASVFANSNTIVENGIVLSESYINFTSGNIFKAYLSQLGTRNTRN